jgi:hypothetical protein
MKENPNIPTIRARKQNPLLVQYRKKCKLEKENLEALSKKGA